jgi:hypothetical protein
VPLGVETVRGIIREQLKGRPLTLLMDGGDSTFGSGMRGKASIYSVFAFTACLPKPVLLRRFIQRDASPTGEALGKMIRDTIAAYEIKDENIMGVCTDNAANAKKSVSAARLLHIPCVAHTLDLSIDAFVCNLGLHALFQNLTAHGADQWPALRVASSRAASQQTAECRLQISLRGGRVRVPRGGQRRQLWQAEAPRVYAQAQGCGGAGGSHGAPLSKSEEEEEEYRIGRSG